VLRSQRRGEPLISSVQYLSPIAQRIEWLPHYEKNGDGAVPAA
jgi:hypothetical protein